MRKTGEFLQLFDDERRDFIAELDVLIDGQYIEELRDEGALLPFRGSSNQRLIDVQASLAAGEAVEYDYALVDK
ncbi:radical SAM protein [Corynebacterium cystitidis]|uniref:radical SAM protein n=1 Tax=Corynebacterium cystitidis TaxID=35757 RepID=UPI00211E0F5F|nr:radical SAM protein [Corynebacterium cystitidis]